MKGNGIEVQGQFDEEDSRIGAGAEEVPLYCAHLTHLATCASISRRTVDQKYRVRAAVKELSLPM